MVMEPWLLEEVVPRLEPDVIVWGLSSMDLSTSYGADNLERYRDALETRTGRLADIEQATARFSALVRYRTILRQPSLFGSERTSIENEFEDAAAILGAGGERLDFTIDVSSERAAEVQARLGNYRIDPNDIDAVERTVNALRTSGTKVVFAIMPTPLRYTTLHPEGATDVARGHETVMVLGELLGVPVIRPPWSDSTDDDFVDFTHLDAAGAARLTRSLAEALPGAETSRLLRRQAPAPRSQPSPRPIRHRRPSLLPPRFRQTNCWRRPGGRSKSRRTSIDSCWVEGPPPKRPRIGPRISIAVITGTSPVGPLKATSISCSSGPHWWSMDSTRC